MEPIAPALLTWQHIHGRHDLPWQRSRDPYRVWLSEIMLQQTQVVTVLGYYERFLQRFPDVVALAAASLDDVLALWAGLGYYSRARNLHRCAQAVVARYGGVFPCRAELLEQLPGIGRSTAAAIAAFCFDERVAILDGNVKRVLTRLLAFDGDLARAAEERRLWERATALLPHAGADMPAYTQGLMDLGATVCLAREPQCRHCPLHSHCVAHAQGVTARYPVKTRKLKRSQRESWWLWLSCGDSLWLQQRPDTGVWAGLWTLPLFDSEAELLLTVQGLPAETPPGVAEPRPDGSESAAVVVLPTVQHVLTHFDWALHPRRVELTAALAVGLDAGLDSVSLPRLPGRWVRHAELGCYGLPAPLRKLLSR